MPDLPKALLLAIGRGALAKHLETCEVCSDDHDCVIAKAHKRSIDGLVNRPVGGGDDA